MGVQKTRKQLEDETMQLCVMIVIPWPNPEFFLDLCMFIFHASNNCT